MFLEIPGSLALAGDLVSKTSSALWTRSFENNVHRTGMDSGVVQYSEASERDFAARFWYSVILCSFQITLFLVKSVYVSENLLWYFSDVSWTLTLAVMGSWLERFSGVSRVQWRVRLVISRGPDVTKKSMQDSEEPLLWWNVGWPVEWTFRLRFWQKLFHEAFLLEDDFLSSWHLCQ